MKQIIPAWLICLLYRGWENVLLSGDILFCFSSSCYRILLGPFLGRLVSGQIQAMPVTGPPNSVSLHLVLPQGAKIFFFFLMYILASLPMSEAFTKAS